MRASYGYWVVNLTSILLILTQMAILDKDFTRHMVAIDLAVRCFANVPLLRNKNTEPILVPLIDPLKSQVIYCGIIQFVYLASCNKSVHMCPVMDNLVSLLVIACLTQDEP